MAKNITEKKLVRQHREHAARVGVAAVQILCSSSLSPFRRRLNLAETVSASWYARYKYIEDATGLTGVAAARECGIRTSDRRTTSSETAEHWFRSSCADSGPRSSCARGRSPAVSTTHTARRSARTTTASPPDPHQAPVAVPAPLAVRRPVPPRRNFHDQCDRLHPARLWRLRLRRGRPAQGRHRVLGAQRPHGRRRRRDCSAALPGAPRTRQGTGDTGDPAPRPGVLRRHRAPRAPAPRGRAQAAA